MLIEMTEGLKQYRLELIMKSAAKLQRKEVTTQGIKSAGYEDDLSDVEHLKLTKEEKELCGII